MFQLTFLGTSSGMPTKYRNVSGLAIECINPYLSGDKIKSKHNRPWVLVDCGEGTQHQLLHTKLSTHQLSTICITHVHGDHCYGLPGLLSSMAMSGRTVPLKLIAPKAMAKLLDTLTITTQLYFSFEVEFIAIEDLLLKQQGQIILDFTATHSVTIDVVELSHRVESYAFGFTQSIKHLVLQTKKLQALAIEPSPIWGRLKNGHDVTLDTGKVLKSADFVDTELERIKIVVAGDNDSPRLLSKLVEEATLLVHESTYTQAVADKIHARPDGMNPQHSTAKQVATFAEEVSLPNLILTHFSARYQLFDDALATQDKQNNMGHIRVEVEQNCQHFSGQFAKHFWLANDFDVYEVRETGVKLLSSVNMP